MYGGTVAHENIDDISGSVSYTCTLYISKLDINMWGKTPTFLHHCAFPWLCWHVPTLPYTPYYWSEDYPPLFESASISFFLSGICGGASQEAFVDHAYCTHQALSQRCAEALQWGNTGWPLDRTQQSVVESARLWVVTLGTLDRDVLPELSFCTVGLHNSA